jgi:hypothetical protein
MSSKTVRDLKNEIANGPGFNQVLSAFSGSFGEALQKVGRHVDCPFPHRHRHGGGKGDFRLFPDFDRSGNAICSCSAPHKMDIFDLLINDGQSTSSGPNNIYKLVDEYVNGKIEGMKPVPKAPAAPVTQEELYAAENTVSKVKWRKDLLRSVQEGLVPFDHAVAEPARLYFKNRGYHVDIGGDSKFHPNLEYKLGGESFGFHPAICTILRDGSGQPVTIHRIFITEDGHKANLAKPKLMMQSGVKGAIPGTSARVRNTEGRVLHTGEGIELMHCISQCVSGTVSAGVSADMMNKQVVNKDKFDRVVIWSDKDPYDPDTKKGAKGQKCALELAQRLDAEGFEVAIMMIKQEVPSDAVKGVDWEDLIVGNDILSLPFDDRLPALVKLSSSIWIQMHLKGQKQSTAKAA